ncbi:uncharacterized protein [Periplaneta americana]|uniref:uncharacterized protein n=1 Tax=Periplaneta americana TaxID=6978 RepID=UPI0037E74A57
MKGCFLAVLLVLSTANVGAAPSNSATRDKHRNPTVPTSVNDVKKISTLSTLPPSVTDKIPQSRVRHKRQWGGFGFGGAASQAQASASSFGTGGASVPIGFSTPSTGIVAGGGFGGSSGFGSGGGFGAVSGFGAPSGGFAAGGGFGGVGSSGGFGVPGSFGVPSGFGGGFSESSSQSSSGSFGSWG